MTARILPPDTAALREYVTAHTGVQAQAASTVRLMVTHSNLKATFMEIRLDMHVRGTACSAPASQSCRSCLVRGGLAQPAAAHSRDASAPLLLPNNRLCVCR